MSTSTRSLGILLLLATALWSCQDQVVTPDATGPEVGAVFKPKKPPPVEDPPLDPWLVGFTDPDLDPDPIRDAWPWIDPLFTLDISADPQTLDARINDAGFLEFESQSFSLALHYGDELAVPTVPGGFWCESESCTNPRKCSSTSNFNVLADLQAISDANSGLTGRLVGISDESGLNFYTTVENAGEALNGHYWFQMCWGNCGAIDTGTYSGLEGESAVYNDFAFWRILNAPTRVYRKDLNSTKDVWTDRTVCGDFLAGSPYRYGAYEVLAMPDGG
jgi:hypothetical protein